MHASWYRFAEVESWHNLTGRIVARRSLRLSGIPVRRASFVSTDSQKTNIYFLALRVLITFNCSSTYVLSIFAVTTVSGWSVMTLDCSWSFSDICGASMFEKNWWWLSRTRKQTSPEARALASGHHTEGRATNLRWWKPSRSYKDKLNMVIKPTAVWVSLVIFHRYLELVVQTSPAILATPAQIKTSQVMVREFGLWVNASTPVSFDGKHNSSWVAAHGDQRYVLGFIRLCFTGPIGQCIVLWGADMGFQDSFSLQGKRHHGVRICL